jgi:hypothetical protein
MISGNMYGTQPQGSCLQLCVTCTFCQCAVTWLDRLVHVPKPGQDRVAALRGPMRAVQSCNRCIVYWESSLTDRERSPPDSWAEPPQWLRRERRCSSPSSLSTASTLTATSDADTDPPRRTAAENLQEGVAEPALMRS